MIWNVYKGTRYMGIVNETCRETAQVEAERVFGGHAIRVVLPHLDPTNQ